jgi:hypothetical protein
MTSSSVLVALTYFYSYSLLLLLVFPHLPHSYLTILTETSRSIPPGPHALQRPNRRNSQLCPQSTSKNSPPMASSSFKTPASRLRASWSRRKTWSSCSRTSSGIPVPSSLTRRSWILGMWCWFIRKVTDDGQQGAFRCLFLLYSYSNLIQSPAGSPPPHPTLPHLHKFGSMKTLRFFPHRTRPPRTRSIQSRCRARPRPGSPRTRRPLPAARPVRHKGGPYR